MRCWSIGRTPIAQPPGSATRADPWRATTPRDVGWAIAAPVSARLGIPWVARAGSRPVHPLAPFETIEERRLWQIT